MRQGNFELCASALSLPIRVVMTSNKAVMSADTFCVFMREESQHDVTTLRSYPQPFKKVTESDICLAAAFALIQPKQLVRAEDEGFEPSIGCPIHAFQACALGRYANPPER